MEIWLASKGDIKNEEELEVAQRWLSKPDSDYSSQYVFLDDKIRSVLSIMLQRALIRKTFSIDDTKYAISRSRENKPFVRLKDGSSGNWNYNVSHHGSFVAIAGSSTELVGIDIVDTLTRAPTMASCAAEFIGIYRKQLAVRERIDGEELKYIHFFILWALKEAYIKAIGSGFGFDPSNIDFVVSYNPGSILNHNNVSHLKGQAVATILGTPRRDWFFDFWALDSHHLIAVARGPLADAIPSFRDATGISADGGVPKSTCTFEVIQKSIYSLK